MKKVLIVISENNKGKFISKGFSAAFRNLSYFVYDMKIYDLNSDLINQLKPDIVFIFWSDITDKLLVEKTFQKINVNPDFIHCAEYREDIPEIFQKQKSGNIFYSEAEKKKNKYVQPVSAIDYKTSFEGYKYNITFAGNPSYQNREIILSELIKNFGIINIFSRSYDFYKSLEDITNKNLLNEYETELYKKSYKGYVDSSKELADIYVSSKINIDMQNQKIKEFNYRLLEITASGAFIIAPYSNSVIKQYDDGKEIETYKDIYELVDKTEFYLKNAGLAQLIALNGKKNTLSNFSYEDKLKNMLKVVYGKDFSSR